MLVWTMDQPSSPSLGLQGPRRSDRRHGSSAKNQSIASTSRFSPTRSTHPLVISRPTHRHQLAVVMATRADGEAQADPDLVLVALQSFLSLPSYLPHLPAILQLFAHLQVLRSVLGSEAARALTINAQLQQDLVDNGVEATDFVAHGGLTATEGKALRRIRGRGEDNEMEMISIQYRRWASRHSQWRYNYVY